MSRYNGSQYSNRAIENKEKTGQTGKELYAITEEVLRFGIRTCVCRDLTDYLKDQNNGIRHDIKKRIEDLGEIISRKESRKNRQTNEALREKMAAQILLDKDAVKTLSDSLRNLEKLSGGSSFRADTVFDPVFSNIALTYFIYPNAKTKWTDEINNVIKNTRDEIANTDYQDKEENCQRALFAYEHCVRISCIIENTPNNYDDEDDDLLTSCLEKEKWLVAQLTKDTKDYLGSTDNIRGDATWLNQWGNHLIDYLNAIKNRIDLCAEFNEDYAHKKDSYRKEIKSFKTDINQIRTSLFSWREARFFEFYGETYEISKERNDLELLLADMAENWEFGKAMLLLETPQNKQKYFDFMHKSLSPDLYLGKYLAINKQLKPGENIDYDYFKLVYIMGGTRDYYKEKRICWKDKSYTESQFAVNVLYNLLQTQNENQFRNRLNKWKENLDGINLRKWAKHHLLSTYYSDEDEYMQTALAFENSLNEYENGEKYEDVIVRLVWLFFQMYGSSFFFFDDKENHLLEWRTKRDIKAYFEDSGHFSSFDDLCDTIKHLEAMPWFNVWLH